MSVRDHSCRDVAEVIVLQRVSLIHQNLTRASHRRKRIQEDHDAVFYHQARITSILIND